MSVIAIDAGTEKSAYVVMSGLKIRDFGIADNSRLQYIIREHWPSTCNLAIEMTASYGKPVGKTIFIMTRWIGRFAREWSVDDDDTTYITRQQVKKHLRLKMSANDKDVRRAIINKYGGNDEKVIGTKKDQGVLYGVSNDVWSALGVGLTFQKL